MGKARILSAQGEGLYSIEILEDRARAESRKTLAEQRITRIDSELTDLDQELAAAQQAVDDGAAAQDQVIADYQAEPTDEHRQAMQDQAAKLITLAEARDAVRLTIASLNLERLTLQTTISSVEALPALRQQDAWCADYTEDLSGEVATAEVPGEIGQVVIRPGYDGGAAWSASMDGAIQPALAGTPASVFYNLAMMPGWQKWRPTFRIATISNINNDLCDITLDAATSSQQGLNVNAQGSYTGVPIMYMDCNGDAFEDGDKVLVAFSGNTDQPMVVGFEQEPKDCIATVYIPVRVMVGSLNMISGGSMYDRPDAPLVPDQNYTSLYLLPAQYDPGYPPTLPVEVAFPRDLFGDNTRIYSKDKLGDVYGTQEYSDIPENFERIYIERGTATYDDVFSDYEGDTSWKDPMEGLINSGAIDLSEPNRTSKNIKVEVAYSGPEKIRVVDGKEYAVCESIDITTLYGDPLWYGIYRENAGSVNAFDCVSTTVANWITAGGGSVNLDNFKDKFEFRGVEYKKSGFVKGSTMLSDDRFTVYLLVEYSTKA